jgi:anti-sigma regulatory factor (Ser/Thr protein kinase)
MSPRHFSLVGRASLRTAREFAAAAGQVLRYWRLPEARVQALELAVAEMGSNVVRHGYRGAEGGPIALELDWDAHGLRIALRDNGLPFDPDAVPAPVEPDPSVPATWPEGGLGLRLIRAAGRLSYRTRADGNEQTLQVEEPHS